MKLVKMLGLSAIAAFAMMAFGASSAMAESTLLCSNANPSPTNCTSPTHFHFISTEKFKLLGSMPVECDVLVLGDTISGNLASPVRVLADLTASNCNNGCTVTSTTGGAVHGVLDLLRLGSEELTDVNWLSFTVKLSCSIFVCDYNSEDVVGHGLRFGGEGKVHITYKEASINLVQKLSGLFNCPSANTLDLLLESLTPLYITS